MQSSLRLFLAALLLLLPILSNVCPYHLAAQTLTMFNPDASGFPLVKAQFYALDNDGRPILNITTSNFTVLESGLPRTVVEIQFPPDPDIRPVSAVLALDISGSMTAESRMDFARDAAIDWIKAISLETSECALTSFDDASYVLQDLTRNRTKLLAAAERLKPLNGTNYDNGFMQEGTGSFTVARRGQFKRIVVFLTDGLGGGQEEKIINAALRDSITVYCITLGLKMPSILRNVATRTGGEWYEDIKTRAELIRIYRHILFQSQNINPATLIWRTEAACTNNRTATITLKAPNAGVYNSSVQYDTPPAAQMRIIAQPRSITFREVAIGNSQGQRVTLRSTYQPITIATIETNNTAFKIGGISLPITVQPGVPVSFVVGFTPQDSTPQIGRIDIRTSACAPVSLYARATYSNKQTAAVQTMRITSPSEGDVLYSGADTLITWSGIMPSEAVALEYSIDGGEAWRSIVESANSLLYRWRVPPVSGQKLVSGSTRPMLVRARQVWTMPEGAEEPDIVLDGHWGSILSAKFSPDGTHILTGSADRTIRLWDAYSGASLHTFEGHSGMVSSVSFSPDAKRILSTGYDNTVRIWDIESGQALATGYGQGLSHFFFSQRKMTGSERLQFASTDGKKFINGAFSPDGQEVATTNDAGMTVQWKAASMRPLGSVREPGGYIFSVAYSRSGNKWLTGGGDYAARIWSRFGTVPEQVFYGHTQQVLHAAFSPDEKRIVTSSEDWTARVWDVKTAKTLFAMRHKGVVWSAEYSPDGKRIVTASLDGTVRLWDAETGKQQAILRSTTGEKLGFQYAEFSPDGSRVVGAGVSTLGFVWEVGGGFLQQAQSKTFHVIAPQASLSDGNAGMVQHGMAKDTMMTLLANNDKSVVRVLDARIIGANANDFSLVSGIPPFDLESGTRKTLELRFAPQDIGQRTATLEVITWTDTLRATLKGESIKTSWRIEQSIAFGQTLVKRRADTALTILRNTGTQPLVITRIQIFGPAPEAFAMATLPARRFPITVPAGDSMALQLSFTPASIGIANAILRVEIAGAIKPIFVSVFGEGILPPMTAHIDAQYMHISGLPSSASRARDTASQSSPGEFSQTVAQKLRIEEFETTIVRSVLNYLFFDENSAEIPARYHRIAPDSLAFFSEEYVNSADSHKLRTSMEGYYHLLNIIGKRLKDRPNISARITGCNSDENAEKSNIPLSRRRAEAVRDYFVQVWGIDSRRITIQARNKPERPSNPIDPDGIAENRRAEIMLEPQESMSPIVSNENIFTADPSSIRCDVALTSPDDVTEWTLEVMYGSRILANLANGGGGSGLPANVGYYRLSSSELRRFAALHTALPGQPLRIRLRASNAAGQSVSAESAPLPYTIITKRQKQESDSTASRFERFALTFFDFDKTALNWNNTQILNLAKSRITEHTEVSVAGYTDRLGDAAYNQRLSTDRANTVAALIPASSSKQVRGFGESVLLYDNSLPEGRFYCRMVEIFLRHPEELLKP